MERYGLEIVDDHIVARIGERRVLVDTGAPQSIGSGTLRLLGEHFALRPGWIGFDTGQLSALIGARVDALIGTDILRHLRFVIDRPKGEVVFHPGPLPLEGTRVTVDTDLGVPLVEFECAGRTERAFLDTGAKLSYLDTTRAAVPAGSAHDYYPGFGVFATDIYRASIGFAGRTRDVLSGRLPELLQMALRMAGTEWILGADVFRDTAIGFDLGHGEVVVG